MRKLLLGLTAVAAALMMSASKGDPFETSKQLEIFTNVLREIRGMYWRLRAVTGVRAFKETGTAPGW